MGVIDRVSGGVSSEKYDFWLYVSNLVQFAFGLARLKLVKVVAW